MLIIRPESWISLCHVGNTYLAQQRTTATITMRRTTTAAIAYTQGGSEAEIKSINPNISIINIKFSLSEVKWISFHNKRVVF